MDGKYTSTLGLTEGIGISILPDLQLKGSVNEQSVPLSTGLIILILQMASMECNTQGEVTQGNLSKIETQMAWNSMNPIIISLTKTFE